MRFTLNGVTFELTADDVEHRLRGVRAEPVSQLGVRVNDTLYPVRQVLEVAIGRPRTEFNSHTARRLLGALGFHLVGEITSRQKSALRPASEPQATESAANAAASSEIAIHVRDPGQEWYSEANVQAAVVAHLAATGWRILSVADTARRERGIDITAALDDATVAIEVKGYPSRHYADPARAGQPKPTHPSNQALHWYAGAVLASMITIGRRSDYRTVIALPDFPRYRDLHRDTHTSLTTCGIAVWWVGADGAVTS